MTDKLFVRLAELAKETSYSLQTIRYSKKRQQWQITIGATGRTRIYSKDINEGVQLAIDHILKYRKVNDHALGYVSINPF